MIKTISQSKINGEVNAPSSKSMMIRAVAMSLLSDDSTKIYEPTLCDDAHSALNILKALNCNIQYNSNFVKIEKPTKITIPNNILCGESALCMRLFAPILALYGQNFTLIANGSLQKRSMQFMQDTFEQLGVQFCSNNGFPPLQIAKTLSKDSAYVDGSLSSQFLSGLLMALPKKNTDTTLIVKNLVSIPYIDMSLQMIKKFGGIVTHNANYSEFYIKGKQNYSCPNISIEGDWSGASAILIAGAISGSVSIGNLNINSAQADKQVLNAIKQTGANVTIKENKIHIKKYNDLQAFNFDAVNCPDLFPALTALAANCKGISKIKGINRLKFKESNRALVLQKEFAKLGININFEGDFMLIEGGKIKGTKTFAHNDHRIAMALCLAGINADGTIHIDGAECVNKTYPNFFDDMATVGAKIMTL